MEALTVGWSEKGQPVNMKEGAIRVGTGCESLWEWRQSAFVLYDIEGEPASGCI